MEIAKMNYKFTAILIALLCLMALFMEPAYPRNEYLNDGNFAAQPNNRCIWDIPSFTVKDNIPDWKVQTCDWNVEDSRAWRTEDTDKFFYEIEEKKND